MSEPAALTLLRARPASGQIRLGGRLDVAAVRRLERHLDSLPDPPDRFVVVHCDAVDAIEPDAALRLWVLCRDRETHDTARIRLLGLPGRLTSGLRRHPLVAFLIRGEEIFADPFRWAPSSR